MALGGWWANREPIGRPPPHNSTGFGVNSTGLATPLTRQVQNRPPDLTRQVGVNSTGLATPLTRQVATGHHRSMFDFFAFGRAPTKHDKTAGRCCNIEIPSRTPLTRFAICNFASCDSSTKMIHPLIQNAGDSSIPISHRATVLQFWRVDLHTSHAICNF